jgi:hypothetical protein
MLPLTPEPSNPPSTMMQIGLSYAIVCKQRFTIKKSSGTTRAPETPTARIDGVTRDIVYFGPKATPEQICDYLNDWRP